ncbi:MAG: YhbY family RNA-binding protein [Candidatus Pacearchaeota archaeon]
MKQIKKLQLGKKGPSPEFIEQLKNILKNEKIIKVSILKSACRNIEEAEKIGEKIVEGLGKNFIYRRIGYVLTIKKLKKIKFKSPQAQSQLQQQAF